ILDSHTGWELLKTPRRQRGAQVHLLCRASWLLSFLTALRRQFRNRILVTSQVFVATLPPSRGDASTSAGFCWQTPSLQDPSLRSRLFRKPSRRPCDRSPWHPRTPYRSRLPILRRAFCSYLLRSGLAHSPPPLSSSLPAP